MSDWKGWIGLPPEDISLITGLPTKEQAEQLDASNIELLKGLKGMTNLAQEMKLLADVTAKEQTRIRMEFVKEEVDQILKDIKDSASKGKYRIHYKTEYNGDVLKSLRDKGFTVNTLNKGATGYSWSVSWE